MNWLIEGIPLWLIMKKKTIQHLTCSKSVMANFWCGMQCLAVQMSSLVSSAMWKWILIRMFSCRDADDRHERKVQNLVGKSQSQCVCFVLRSTLQRRPWCRAETAARPGRFWRARCEERRTVKLSHCCTETERRYSEEETDTARSETGSWSSVYLRHQADCSSPSERRRCTSPPCTYESSADGNCDGRYRDATGPERQRQYTFTHKTQQHLVRTQSKGTKYRKVFSEITEWDIKKTNPG